jgi:hypothetical protein
MSAFVNAAGGTTPPIFVFPQKKPNPQLIKEGPDGCLRLVHESGSMTGDNFYACMVFFHGIVRSSKSYRLKGGEIC